MYKNVPILTCGLNTNLYPTSTRVEMDCAVGVHITRSGGYINGSVRGLRETEERQVRMHSLWVLLGWDALWLALFVNTQIWSGVSWFWWQSVEAIWHGFKEASIYVRSAKTSIFKPQWLCPLLGLLPGAWGALF